MLDLGVCVAVWHLWCVWTDGTDGTGVTDDLGEKSTTKVEAKGPERMGGALSRHATSRDHLS